MRFLDPRWVRPWALTLLPLATIMALLWAPIDWSGERRWREARAMLAMKGQTLDFRVAAPDPIPAAENFCAIPLLKDIALVIDDDERKGEPGRKRTRLGAASLPFEFLNNPPEMRGAERGQRTDLKQWAKWMQGVHLTGSPFVPGTSGDAAPDVLAGLSQQEDAFRELAAGLDRTRAQWTPPWKTRVLPRRLVEVSDLPHLSLGYRLSATLGVRCVAAARAGNAPVAHESLQIMVRLSQASLQEPLLDSLGLEEWLLDSLDSAAYARRSVANAAWELCDAQAGATDDFARLESALAGLDFRRATWRATESEIIALADEFQAAKKSADDRFLLFGSFGNYLKCGSPLRATMIRWIPPSYFNATSVEMTTHGFAYLSKPSPDRGWQAALESARDFDAALKDMTPSRGSLSSLWKPSIPSRFTEAICYALHEQTLVNQAAIACALERYRIANGSYPDSLALVTLADGQPLPVDILTGKPMGYRKTANGKYALWCVSLNGKDHGGKRAPDKVIPDDTEFWNESYAGDWVWDFPEK